MATTLNLAPVTYQNIGTNPNFLIIPRGAGSVNVYNGDITNVLLLSHSPTPVLSNSIPVQPLTNATIDAANRQYYGAAQSGTISSVTVSSASQLSPSPAQIAQQIQALGLATAANQGTQITAANLSNGYLGGTQTGALISGAGRTLPQEVAALLATGLASGTPGGIPLLRFTNNLGSGASVNLPANSSTVLLNAMNIFQPGYEGAFNLFFPAASGTVPFVRLDFLWTDITTGLQVGQRSMWLTAGNAAGNVLPFYVAGPVRGNRLTVTANNLDPAVAGTLTWAINQTSHIYPYDKILQPFYAASAPNGFTNPGGTPSNGVIFESVAGIPANSSITRLSAVFGGKGEFSCNNTSAAGVSVTASLTDPLTTGAGLYGLAQARLITFNLAAGTSQTAQFNLPYGPISLQLVNGSTTTAASGNWALAASDY